MTTMTISEKLRSERPRTSTSPVTDPSRRAAAFFDLDGTLIPGSANIPLAKAAFRAGMVTPPELVRDLRNGVSFLVQGASDERSAAVRDRILGAVAGRPADEVIGLADDFMAGLVDSITPTLQTVLADHAAAGRDRVVLSASPTEIVARLAEEAGLELGAGTTSEIDADGRYTGRLAGPFCYAEGKAEILRDLAEERGYDLARCYAYSDSLSDLPMLEAVGHPVAVNPEPGLRELAEERGWPIVETSRLPRVSVGDVRSWGRLGQRVVASAVGAIVSRGTRPVEDVDELDAGDVPGAVLVNPDLFEGSEDRVLAHGRA
jgi:HAD superfamily hydrolase (TIGR01490 family)